MRRAVIQDYYNMLGGVLTKEERQAASRKAATTRARRKAQIAALYAPSILRGETAEQRAEREAKQAKLRALYEADPKGFFKPKKQKRSSADVARSRKAAAAKAAATRLSKLYTPEEIEQLAICAGITQKGKQIRKEMLAKGAVKRQEKKFRELLDKVSRNQEELPVGVAPLMSNLLPEIDEEEIPEEIDEPFIITGDGRYRMSRGMGRYGLLSRY